jgi:hypothetical protein
MDRLAVAIDGEDRVVVAVAVAAAVDVVVDCDDDDAAIAVPILDVIDGRLLDRS